MGIGILDEPQIKTYTARPAGQRPATSYYRQRKQRTRAPQQAKKRPEYLRRIYIRSTQRRPAPVRKRRKDSITHRMALLDHLPSIPQHLRADMRDLHAWHFIMIHPAMQTLHKLWRNGTSRWDYRRLYEKMPYQLYGAAARLGR